MIVVKNSRSRRRGDSRWGTVFDLRRKKGYLLSSTRTSEAVFFRRQTSRDYRRQTDEGIGRLRIHSTDVGRTKVLDILFGVDVVLVNSSRII